MTHDHNDRQPERLAGPTHHKLETTAKPLISSWSVTPVPALSLSAAGLLALADLNTVAQRTVITGGSSLLDALVLAPGLQYQQAADALDQQGHPALSAVLLSPRPSTSSPTPPRRSTFAACGEPMTPPADATSASTSRGPNASSGGAASPPLSSLKGILMDRLSHVLYLSSPILTVACAVVMVLLADWWGLSFILALMTSRVLNIWSIKQRSSRPPPPPPHPAPDDAEGPSEYAVDVGGGSRILLRGAEADIQAVTAQVWLRRQTASEGFLEAAAKLAVYLVAAFSGNQTQAGALVVMASLLVSAGLLGLSNAHAREVRVNGRVARVQAVEAVAREVAKADLEQEIGFGKANPPERKGAGMPVMNPDTIRAGGTLGWARTSWQENMA
ncbi:hypothetical protein UVI_02059040 [Ustilaginoidea virens]|uniref:Uncharacterized protein n=1 Tax=Ustilaginoidea virens TaxID=1159556 RepID=A0A1B5L577_USTVR|nr:hypothetical protein UVI_02059040 [Ustilaginoidea virens]